MANETRLKEHKDAAARARLIEAGMDVFGEHGFAGSSTRMIAGAAGTNIAAIPYYFGGKEGLYQAVVAHIVGRVRERMDSGIKAAMAQASRRDATPGELLDGLKGLLTALAVTMIGSSEARRWARIILQEHVRPSAAFDILYQGLFNNMLDAGCALVGRLTGLPADSEELTFLTQSLLGQVLVFRIGEAVLLRRLGQDSVSPAQVAKLAGLVAANVEAIIRGANVRKTASAGEGEA